jgi:hypothetical protein
MDNTMNNKQPTLDVQRLRNLLLLGMEDNDWLSQKVIDTNSIDFFQYILPRTKEKAILNLAIQIACIEHDKNVQGNKYHLFSLPYNIEKGLESNCLVNRDVNYMDELEGIAGSIAIDSKPGPILVGAIDELSGIEIYRIITKHYLTAFKNGYKTFPYLS